MESFELVLVMVPHRSIPLPQRQLSDCTQCCPPSFADHAAIYIVDITKCAKLQQIRRKLSGMLYAHMRGRNKYLLYKYSEENKRISINFFILFGPNIVAWLCNK